MLCGVVVAVQRDWSAVSGSRCDVREGGALVDVEVGVLL